MNYRCIISCFIFKIDKEKKSLLNDILDFNAEHIAIKLTCKFPYHMLKNLPRTFRLTLSLLRRYCNLRQASEEIGSRSCL